MIGRQRCRYVLSPTGENPPQCGPGLAQVTSAEAWQIFAD